MAELRRTKKLKSCKALRYDGSPCGRPLYDDKYCIFHSKDIERKKEEFEKAFWEEFERQEEEDKFFDFSEFIFPKDISFEEKEFKKPLWLSGAIFHGLVTFNKAKFSIAEFHEKAYSNRAKFSTPIFWVTKFSKKVDFSKAEFSPGVFYGAIFYEKADFAEAYLEKVSGLFESLREKKGIFKKIKYKIDDFRLMLGPEAEAKYPIIAKKIKDTWFLTDFKNQYPNIYLSLIHI